MTGEIVTVFGGSGFVGRNVVRELAKAGYRIRVAVRKPQTAYFLQPMGDVGQIQVVRANIREDASVAAALRGADHVINLVGILYSSGKQSFKSIQAEGPARIARLAAEAGARRFIQMSAIGANAKGTSTYARTKAAGEAGARDAFAGTTVLRPSIVFGPEDDFFNRFANMARFAPVLPLFGGGKNRFQPVHVDDVADAVIACLADPATAGRTYELGGPEIVTFKRCMELILEITARTGERVLLPLPTALAYLIGAAGSLYSIAPILGPPPLTFDQVKLLGIDNVVGLTNERDIGTLSDLGITPNGLEAILPSYLYRFRKHGQYTATGEDR